MSRPRVGVLLDAFSSAGLQEIAVATSSIYPVIIVVPFPGNPFENLLRVASLRFETHLWDETVLARLNLQGIATFSDRLVPLRDRVQAQLGLPRSCNVEHAWDKLVQRRVLWDAGISAIQAMPVEAADELQLATETLGLPGVLKPRRSSASEGVVFVTDQQLLTKLLTSTRDWSMSLFEQPARGDVLNKIPADYVSVETLVSGRVPIHLGIFDKLPLALDGDVTSWHSVRETGDMYPTSLDQEGQDAVTAIVSQALDALGVQFGLFHTEVMVSEKRVEIIEVNGRLGGEIAPHLKTSLGVDVVVEELRLACGLGPSPAVMWSQLRPASPPGQLGTLFVPFPVREGVVSSRASPEAFVALDAVSGVVRIAKLGESFKSCEHTAVKVRMEARSREHLLAEMRDVVRLCMVQFPVEFGCRPNWCTETFDLG